MILRDIHPYPLVKQLASYTKHLYQHSKYAGVGFFYQGGNDVAEAKKTHENVAI